VVTRPCLSGVYTVDDATADRIRAADRSLTLWTIDGAVANSREDFFPSLAAALRFPAYFGRNWDATYDCLTDLASAAARPALLMIADGDAFISGMGDEWTRGQRVFSDAAAFWEGQGRLLLIILISDNDSLDLPTLPADCLDKVLASMTPDVEIAQADARIRTLNRAGQFEEALQAARDLVTRFPDHPGAHFVLAGAYDFQDREHDALAPYQRAWELGLSGEDVPRFYVQYGSTLRNVGRYEESVRLLEEGHARFPDHAAIQAFLALALLSAGRSAEAVATALWTLVHSSGTVDLDGYDRALREYIAELRPPQPAS
jgi:tetratricopeptide (TPR) repeat protein